MKKLKKIILSSEFKLFTIIIVVLTALTAFVYLKGYVPTPIKSDGRGYYLYLPAIFIHQDIKMEWTIAERIEDNHTTDLTDEWYGTTQYEDTGNILNKYTVGLAILWIPFFLIADFLTVLFQLERDGFGIFYHVSIGFSGIVAAATGTVLLFKLLKRYFSKHIALATSLLILFGTNLLHYATYDSTFTHAFSFAILTALLLATIKFYEKFEIKYGFLVGVLLGLGFLLRPTNALFVIIFLLYGVSEIKDVRLKIKDFFSHYKSWLVILFSGLITTLPQFLYWKYITGHWLVFSYQGEYFDFTNPQILNVLFSTQKGLFFYTPILLFGVIGLFLMRKYVKNFALGSCIYLLISTYIISSWWAWQYGSSFGHRIFIDSYAVFSLGLASCIAFIQERSKIVRYILYFLFLITIFLSLFVMLQYWQGDLPQEGTTWEQYVEVWRHQFGVGEIKN